MCPENTAKSAFSAVTLTGTCPALWVQSKHSRTEAPIRPRNSSSVVIDPNTLCTCVATMSRVRGDTFDRMSPMSASPVAVTEYGTSVMRVPDWASTCRRFTHGYTVEE